MSQAKDKDHYIKSWNAHIQTLSSLGMPLLDTPRRGSMGYYEELTLIQARLEELVLIAADEDFKDE